MKDASAENKAQETLQYSRTPKGRGGLTILLTTESLEDRTFGER